MASRDDNDGSERAPARSTPWYIEYPLLLLGALVLLFVFHTVVGRVYVIPSASMEPTLHGCPGCTGDRIFVDKLSYRFGSVEQGDVVVFRGDGSWNDGYASQRSSNPVRRTFQNLGEYAGIVPPDENTLVKRVIAVGGQTVGGCSPRGELLVDSTPLPEPYLHDDPAITHNPANCAFGPVTVPQGRLWVMGDNRNNSKDSRYHLDFEQGTISEGDVVGKTQAIVLPFSRIGGVE